MATVHNSANIEDIAKTVIMPGDPLRSKFIAETFLKDAKLINNVRGIQGYTGTYNGKKVTVMASGMGCPTMGIYSYELFKFYNVEKIIRIGSIGSLSKNINLKELIIVEKSYSNTNYNNFYINNNGSGYIEGSKELVTQAEKIAKNKKIKYHIGNVFCTDTFYSEQDDNQNAIKLNLIGVEMESAALYINANKLNKKALCICTVSDNIITNEQTSSEERQEAFTDMMHVALEMI